MSNSKLIKIAAAVFAMGIILFFVGSLFGGRGIFLNSSFQISVADDMEYFEFEDRDLEAFSGVNIDVANMPVTFLPSDNDLYGVKLAYYATDKDNMTVTVKDNTLTVEYEPQKRYISFDFSFLRETKKEYVIVYLPKQEYGTIDVSTSNGMILLEKVDVVVKKLILDTSNGPITASDISTDMVTADTSNGPVSLSGIVSEEIRVKTSNAPVKVSFGEISVLEIRTSNGPVHLDGLTFAGKPDVFVNTSNGGISVDFATCSESDFRVKADTSNANIFVNGDNLRDNHYTTKDGDGRLNLKTSNGRIEMYFGLD